MQQQIWLIRMRGQRLQLDLRGPREFLHFGVLGGTLDDAVFDRLAVINCKVVEQLPDLLRFGWRIWLPGERAIGQRQKDCEKKGEESGSAMTALQIWNVYESATSIC
ncbi:hypothetical protein LP419_40620 [Massilia sp. H-1]|nr:hypothetical protein LP419_40620 [Massilia sp. H-1]